MDTIMNTRIMRKAGTGRGVTITEIDESKEIHLNKEEAVQLFSQIKMNDKDVFTDDESTVKTLVNRCVDLSQERIKLSFEDDDSVNLNQYKEHFLSNTLRLIQDYLRNEINKMKRDKRYRVGKHLSFVKTAKYQYSYSKFYYSNDCYQCMLDINTCYINYNKEKHEKVGTWHIGCNVFEFKLDPRKIENHLKRTV